MQCKIVVRYVKILLWESILDDKCFRQRTLNLSYVRVCMEAFLRCSSVHVYIYQKLEFRSFLVQKFLYNFKINAHSLALWN